MGPRAHWLRQAA